MSEYIRCLSQLPKIYPNFWTSEEYFWRAKFKEKKIGGYYFVLDGEQLVFPPVNEKGFLLNIPFWSDFEGMDAACPDLIPEFLDHEYIYFPPDFEEMEGGKWEVFRKNSRKFFKRHPGKLRYMDYIGDGHDLFPVLEAWLEPRSEEEEIHDDDVMLDYIQKGEYRKVLVDDNNKIYGVNIWDANYHYTNYRYCICYPGNFLSECMRLLFYQDKIRNSCVNDGGSLDNPLLERFKDKMNPLSKRKVYSWRKV